MWASVAQESARSTPSTSAPKRRARQRPRARRRRRRASHAPAAAHASASSPSGIECAGVHVAGLSADDCRPFLPGELLGARRWRPSGLDRRHGRRRAAFVPIPSSLSERSIVTCRSPPATTRSGGAPPRPSRSTSQPAAASTWCLAAASAVVSSGDDLFGQAASYASQFHESLGVRRVGADGFDATTLRAALGGPLPDDGAATSRASSELIAAAEPGVVGPDRAALLRLRHRRGAARSGRGRLAGDRVGPERASTPSRRRPPPPSRRSPAAGSPSCSACPPTSRVGFVTGAPDGEHHGARGGAARVLARPAGTSRRDGLIGAPPIRVVVGEEGTSPIDRSLRLLGLGTSAVERVAADDQGRMRADALRERARAAPTGRRSSAPGRQREHRRVRSARRDRATLARATAPGCTSTARSGCGPPPRPRCRHLVDGSSAPTRGPPTRTSGSTCRTTAASSSARDRDAHAAAMAVTAAYLVAPAAARARPTGPGVVAPGPRLRRLGGAALARPRRASRSSSSAAARSPGGSPTRWRRAGRRDPQRGRAQPGARPLRLTTTDASRARSIAAVQADGTCWLGGTSGRAARRCGSRCRTCGRRARTWTARPRRSSRHPGQLPLRCARTSRSEGP